jgi:hypothetical protein
MRVAVEECWCVITRHSNSLLVVVQSNRDETFLKHLFASVLHKIESTITASYFGLDVKRLTPCPKCREFKLKPNLIPVEILMFGMRETNGTVLCSNHPEEGPIVVSEVAPDIAMADLNVIDPSQVSFVVFVRCCSLFKITIQQEIGRGGFGVVYLANYRGNKVAVKQSLHTELDANQFTEFQLVRFR